MNSQSAIPAHRNRWRPSLAVSALLSAWLAVGCTPAPESAPPGAAPKPEQAAAGKTADPANPSSEEALMHFREQVAWAVNDLAERLGLPPESIGIDNAQPVTWRSSALGCPQPDRSYMEALVPGVRILLRAGEKIYAYHAAVARQPFACPLERSELPVYDEHSDQL